MLSHMTSTERSRVGFVLAGGKSSRMGTNVDKAFLKFSGETLLNRALTLLGTVCDSVTIVGNPDKFAKYGHAVADIFPGCGPLAGIHTALAHSSADLNLMLAVDMPFVSTDLIAFLLNTAAANGDIVTVPRTCGGLQPLCAVYRRGFATVAEEALRAGKYKIDAVFACVSIRVITEDELAAAGFSEQSFFNVNTPHDRLSAEGRSYRGR
jgi:molybdopterin-guanine dinucleotide biosynthesis protein A